MVSENVYSANSNILLVAEKSINSQIQAHESELGALSVNPEGTLIASAS